MPSDTQAYPDETARRHDSNETENGVKAEFKVGRLVCLKSDGAKYGPVMNIEPGLPEATLQVFIDNRVQTYYASQLETYTENNPQTLSADRFRALLSALEMLHPGASLYSLNSARIDYIPYQYRPVLRFIKADRPRMLIADSVGVGKTIEAGLIMKELQARKDVLNSILIICPKALVTEEKWLNEMKRFDEDFEHLDGDDIRFCINETYLNEKWPERRDRVIIPYSKFNDGILYGRGRNKGLLQEDDRGKPVLALPPHFDLVIVDEAHHIRNTNTSAYKAVKYFCENADAVLFLTATPIQLGDHDLFVQLNLLRPDLIIDQETFQHMAEPNPFINSAVSAMREQTPDWRTNALDFLNQAADTDWGKRILLAENHDFIKVKEKLSQDEVSKEDRVRMITMTENLHTFSGIINRTRRRDIGDFTVRKAEAREIPFTPEQKRLHDSLLDIQRRIFTRIHGSQNVKFMMTTIRRQAASCIFGLRPFLEEMLTRHADALFTADILNDAADDTYGDDFNTNEIALIERDIEELLEAAKSLTEDDPKFDELLRIVNEKQKLDNHRIMLFSSFRHTLNYLNRKLRENGFRIGLIHGGVPDDERRELAKRFRKGKEEADAVHILLFSEVGSEGLDYQFCDCMVNYDLPWNPMRIEQRIGRIDRNGQKSPAVAIYNMLTPDTVDYDIYERCLSRIGVFRKSIGDCEEILGDITREIKSIGEDFTLNGEQMRRKLEALEENKIKEIQEKLKLEDEKYNFIGLQLPKEQFDREIEEASNFYLAPASIERLVNLYLQDTAGGTQESILGKEPLKTLRLALDHRNSLLDDFKKLPRQRSDLYRKWENWLRGADQYLSVTFEPECAENNPKAAFLSAFHPLVRQAAEHFAPAKAAMVKLETVSSQLNAGDYAFAVYQWTYHGVREDRRLMTIAESDTISELIEDIIKTARDCSDADIAAITEQTINNFNTRQHDVWASAREEHAAGNRLIIQYQRQSLKVSHKARLAVLNDSLSTNPDERIRRMRQGEIANAEADYGRRLINFDEAEKRADIEFMPVVYGVLRIKRE
jgi:SNF2 family DNA or RNA helicase